MQENQQFYRELMERKSIPSHRHWVSISKHLTTLIMSSTFGMSVGHVTCSSAIFQICFIISGGQKSLRSYWRNYFEATEAIIWVVDSVDKMRLGECRSELQDLLKEERLMGSSLLVFANKQDIVGACSLQEIRSLLDLDSIHKHHWTVMPCSALTGQNLLEGIDWLVNDVAQRLFDPD